MMGTAMLECHRFMQSLWASYGVPFGQNVYPGKSGTALVGIFKNSARGYPMMGAAMLKHHRFVQSLRALYRLVVSSITFGHHLYVGESGTALVQHQKSNPSVSIKSDHVFRFALKYVVQRIPHLFKFPH